MKRVQFKGIYAVELDGEDVMFDFDYPKVKQSLGQAALQDSYPAYFLDPRGVIYAANLMAFWLWDMIQPGEAIRRDSLLGKSVFNILAENFERIPADQNAGFYAKRAAFVKRMEARLGPSLYTTFIAAMKADPTLAQIYEQAVPHPEREWDYTLRVAPPGLRDTAQLLEFQVTTYRLEEDNGFLGMYSPAPGTLPVVEEQHSLLMNTYSDNAYVLLDDTKQDKGESNLLPAKLTGSSRPYYPSLVHDSLWYITEENKAMRLLGGASIVGMHFFELFFAPQLREWLGPLHETTAPRAIRYFDIFTASFLREDHELHDGYEQVMKRLLQLPGFPDLLDTSRKLNIHINLPDNFEASFYTCRALLPWPLAYEVALQFRSMVRFIYKSPLTPRDRRHYQVTLVPESYETEVALILLHLASSGPEPGDDVSNTSLKQFLWALAIMKTVEEGLTTKDEENMQWEPETTFERIRKGLDVESGLLTEEATDDAIAELKVIIERLDRRGMLDKAVLLSMLQTYSLRLHLDQLSKFFTRELEVLTRVKVEK